MKQRVQSWKHRFRLQYNAWLLHSLVRITFWGDKFRQRLSSFGLGLIAALVITLVFGASIKLSSIYQLFSLFVALLLVSLFSVWFLSKRHKVQVEVKRSLPPFATEGVPITYNIQVENTTKQNIFYVSVSEIFKRETPSLYQFLNTEEPGEAQRNWYDRQTGFYRFVWLQNWLRGAVVASAPIKQLKAGETHTCSMSFVPLRRGYVHFSNIRLRSPEPLALAYVFEDHQAADTLLVLPKWYHVPIDLMLGGLHAYQQGGLSQSIQVGESEEFSRLREYRGGDSLRHMHWASLARVGQPLIKEFQDESFTRSTLILDNFVGEVVSKRKNVMFEAAVSVAAGFAMQTEHHMPLDLMFSGHQEQELMIEKPFENAEQMLKELATLQACEHTSFSLLANHVLEQVESLSSCVFILLGWDEARQNLVKQLSTLDIPLRIFLLQDKAQPVGVDLGVEHFHVLNIENIQEDLDKIV